MNEILDIQIVSDVVCPWCYVGKRRLERALAERPDLDVAVTWLPFQLSPDLPREGQDRATYYAEKFGPERARTLQANMQKTAAAEGLHFDSGPGARTPNTLSAHVLLLWAAEQPEVNQDDVVERLFAAHHSLNQDIGDVAVLARIAGEAGMDPVGIEADLRAGRDEDRVQALIRDAQRLGISGVPHFVFDRRYAVSGAQAPEALLQVIDRFDEARAPRPGWQPAENEV
ncbi:MAG TPA: DsbA family oxidoreductase [Woeseiaceae bacterium]|nr:DsbA family oxidoreductase [Woeseiaceae bacterium]